MIKDCTILGIDPGTNLLGFGIVRVCGGKPQFVDMGVLDLRRYILEHCRMLIDGRFLQEQKTLALPFRGSTNQRLVDVQASLKAGETVLFDETV